MKPHQSHPTSRSPFTIAASIACSCLLALPIAAQTRTWNGSANAFWSNAGNWNEGAFENGANVVFPAGAANRNNAIGAGRAVQSITINSDALAYRIGTSNNNSGTASPLTLTFRNNGVLTVDEGNTSSHSIGRNSSNANVGNVNLAGNFIVNQNGTGLLSFTRPISGSGNLTKNGSGEVRLVAGSSYSGPTTVNEGTFSLIGGNHASAITVETDGALGLDPASPPTSSSSVNLTNGGVLVLGSPEEGEDHLLMTATGGFTGVPTLADPDPEFDLELRAEGTELWLVPSIEVITIIIDLGEEGTEIKGGAFITTGPDGLPLPNDLPVGSILTRIDVDTVLAETDNENFAYDLTLLFGESAGDFLLAVTGTTANVDFEPEFTVNWAEGAGNGGEETPLVATITSAAWESLGPIDLATTGLFLGNSYNDNPANPDEGGTWTGTITLTVIVPPEQTIKADNTEDLNLGESWVGGVAPESADLAVWDSTVTSANSTVLGADVEWGGIVIKDPAGPVTIGGADTLTLGGGIDLGTATQDLTLDCPLVLAASSVWNVDADRTLALDGGVSGPFAVTKDGAGTVTLQSDNLLTGTISISAGTLDVHGSIADSAAIMNDGALVLDSDSNDTYGNVIGGSGTLTKQGNGTLTFDADNTYSGDTIIGQGVLQIGTGGTSGTLGGGTNTSSNTLIAEGAELRIDRSTDNFGYNYFGQLSGSGTVNILEGRRLNFRNATANQTESGDLSFVVDGILGINTSTGVNDVRLGELGGSGIIQRAGNPPSPLTPPYTLIVGGKNTSSTYTGSFGNIAELDLVKTGTGSLTLTGGSDSYGGDITVESGTLIGAGAVNSPGVAVFGARNNTRTITVNDGGTLEFRSGNVLGANHVATTAPTLVINSGGTVTNAAPASNNALHDIELNGGTLTATTGHQSGSAPFLPIYAAWNLNGTVTSTGESTISTSDPVRGTVMLKSTGDKTTEFNVVSGTLTVSAPVIDNPTDGNIGSLRKTGAGTMVVSGPMSYSGTTFVDEGLLVLGSINTSTTPTTVAIAASGATLELDFAGNKEVAALEIGGVPQGPGIYGAVGSESPVIGIPQITGTGTIEVPGAPPAGYAAWADANVGGQGPELDFDGDGVANGIEFFLDAAPGFTALPTLDANNTITWTNGGNIPASEYGTQFVVQTSGNLVDWTDVLVGDLDENSDGPDGSLTYKLTGTDPRFVRLKVTPE